MLPDKTWCSNVVQCFFVGDVVIVFLEGQAKGQLCDIDTFKRFCGFARCLIASDTNDHVLLSDIE